MYSSAKINMLVLETLEFRNFRDNRMTMTKSNKQEWAAMHVTKIIKPQTDKQITWIVQTYYM